jgi:gas vesicle protein
MVEKTDITGDTPPEVIEKDIARTRQEMSGTVGEIGERLSAVHLKEQAMDTIRETTTDKVNKMKNTASRIGQNISHTAKESTSTMINAVKNNPVPLAMISAGVAWLMFSRTRGPQALAGRSSALKEQAGELSGKARSKVEELSGQIRESGSEYASKASETAERFRSTARDRASAASTRLQDMIEKNPLGVTLWALVLGALAGFAIPESRKEHEVLGPASESLLSRARETAQRTFQKAQHAAERAAQTAGEEFKKSAA